MKFEELRQRVETTFDELTKRGMVADAVRIILGNLVLDTLKSRQKALRFCVKANIPRLTESLVVDETDKAIVFLAAAQYGRVEILTKFLDVETKVDEAFKLSVEHGHLDIVKILLAKEPEDIEFNLHLAIENGHLEVVKYLANSKFNLDVLLLTAIVNDRVEIADHLLKLGADVNVLDETTIKMIVTKKSLFMIQTLLSHGIKPALLIDHVLSCHTFAPREDIISCLFSHKLDPNPYVRRIVSLAKEDGNAKMIKVLIKNGVGVETYYNDLFESAVSNQHCDMIRLTVKHVNEDVLRASFTLALDKKLVESIRVLVEEKAYKDMNMDALFRKILKLEAFDLAKILLKRETLSRELKRKALRVAVRHNNFNLVIFLVNMGTRPAGQHLISACRKQYVSMGKLLLSLGARISDEFLLTLLVNLGNGHEYVGRVYQDLDLMTFLANIGHDICGSEGRILLQAIDDGNLDFVKLALRSKIDPKIGKVCLAKAVETNKSDLIRCFLERGVFLENNEVILLAAIRNNDLRLIKCLVAHGVKPEEGKASLLKAIKGNMFEIVKCLIGCEDKLGDGRIVLFDVAKRGDNEMVRALLKEVDFDTLCKMLLESALNTNPIVADLLVKRGLKR